MLYSLSSVCQTLLKLMNAADPTTLERKQKTYVPEIPSTTINGLIRETPPLYYPNRDEIPTCRKGNHKSGVNILPDSLTPQHPSTQLYPYAGLLLSATFSLCLEDGRHQLRSFCQSRSRIVQEAGRFCRATDSPKCVVFDRSVI